MPERYVEAIMKYLASRDYQPLKPRQLARQMGVSEDDYGSFRQAVKQLRDAGRVVLGARNALMLPEMSTRVLGVYRANQRGFGFVTPETPNAHGDLFIPEGESGGAMDGDTVVAKVVKRGRRGGEMLFSGRVVEIIRRGSTQVVGTLEQSEQTWFVLPDGRAGAVPVVIPDVGPGAKPGQKVVAEIVSYPRGRELHTGVITENLGAAGPFERAGVELLMIPGGRREGNQQGGAPRSRQLGYGQSSGACDDQIGLLQRGPRLVEEGLDRSLEVEIGIRRPDDLEPPRPRLVPNGDLEASVAQQGQCSWDRSIEKK